MDDDIAAEEIARQIAALKPRLEARGVMGYLDKSRDDKRADVNKTFLASTIRGVNSHNRRQEEDKCWTLRRMERKLDESRDRRSSRKRRSPSRDRRSNEKKRRRSPSRSRSRSRSRHRRREERSSRHPGAEERGEDEDERSYWARKKVEKTQKLWENLHTEGTVSVENAPDFSSEESDDDDIKPAATNSSLDHKEKKHKKHKKHKRKCDKKAKRRRSRS